MVKTPHMLLISAAGRNTGKTTLACRLIQRLRAVGTPVASVKVTTVHERNGECPRGGEGCGVCSALEGNWALTEERGQHPDKDTGRLQRAGAEPVYWLQVCVDHLDEGIAALSERLPAGRAVVVESSSMRKVVRPGVFVITTLPGRSRYKPSVQAVRHHADRLVTFDGEDFDLPLEDLQVVDGRWCLRRQATAVVMAGGDSRRMGTDKTMLDVDGQPLIAHIVGQLEPHFAEILISANDAERFAFMGKPVVPDRETGCGPLMGIASVLEAATYDSCFVVAADIPELDLDFVATLMRQDPAADVVVPRDAEGHFEPLYAVYRRSFLPAARSTLAAGRRQIFGAYDEATIHELPFEPAGGAEAYHNLNTPQDVEQYKRWRDR